MFVRVIKFSKGGMKTNSFLYESGHCERKFQYFVKWKNGHNFHFEYMNRQITISKGDEGNEGANWSS